MKTEEKSVNNKKLIPFWVIERALEGDIQAINKILKHYEGYIAKYDLVDNGNFKDIHMTLKYGKDKNDKIIAGLKRISKPGLRVYADKENLPKVLGGLGTAILSTNQGVITDKEARKLGVGGEVLAFVW